MLRLYPAGLPDTHLIKLRFIGQTRILGPTAGTWGVLQFEPGNPVQPLKHLTAGLAAIPGDNTYLSSAHVVLEWTDKTDLAPATAALINRQPYGWDQWQTTAGSTTYKYATVLGSRIKLSFLEGVQDEPATNNMLAGWAKGIWGSQAVATDIISFSEKYTNINNGEPMDAVNVKMFKPRPLNDPGVSITVGKANNFYFNYSLKKAKRQLKKMGAASGTHYSDENFRASGNTAPVYKPRCFFVVADRGSTPPTGLDCIVTIDYTIRLTGRIIADKSVL